MVARMSAHATRPLARATYQGILPIGQLPPVLVCDRSSSTATTWSRSARDVPPTWSRSRRSTSLAGALAAAAVDDVVVAPWPSLPGERAPEREHRGDAQGGGGLAGAGGSGLAPSAGGAASGRGRGGGLVHDRERTDRR